MNNEENKLKEQSNNNQIDLSTIEETFKKVLEMVKPLIETLVQMVRET